MTQHKEEASDVSKPSQNGQFHGFIDKSFVNVDYKREPSSLHQTSLTIVAFQLLKRGEKRKARSGLQERRRRRALQLYIASMSDLPPTTPLLPERVNAHEGFKWKS